MPWTNEHFAAVYRFLDDARALLSEVAKLNDRTEHADVGDRSLFSAAELLVGECEIARKALGVIADALV